MNECLKIFKQIKRGINIDEDDLFTIINGTSIQTEEFLDFKEI